MRNNVKGFGVCLLAGAVVAVCIATQSHTAEPASAPAGGPTATSASTQYPGKVDPIKENGAIFVGWPKPDVALVFTGEQDGYLEPCGCAGLENQKGGLMRRFTFLKELREKGWPVVALDSGGQAKRSTMQAKMKLEFAYRALALMKYDAIGIGPEDLRLDLLSVIINLEEAPQLFVSANVAVGDFQSDFWKRYKVIESGGMKIGVTSVLGKKEIAGFTNATDFAFKDPEEALAEVLPEMQKEKCDQLVLLCHAGPEETKALAKRFPEFNWVTTAHGADEPPKEPSKIDGSHGLLIEVGHKAMYAVVVGLYKNGGPTFRYQRVPFDHRFSDAPEIHKMHIDYQDQLKQIVEQADWAGLELKPSLHPTGRKFAGSEVCAGCHSTAAAVFAKTPHAHATDTLVKLNPPRHFDPECLSCHATGWDPQNYFPFESGFKGLKDTPALVGNGCENCHGPAAQHVAAESGETDLSEAEIEKLRAALRLKIVENEGNKPEQVYKEGGVVDMCMHCHDIDNSPEFDFQKYWPKVKHAGKD